MAVSALRTCLVLAVLLCCSALGHACFGPKLYLGVPDSVEGEALAELAALYIKEKTGVESILVPLEAKDPVTEIQQERLDLVVSLHGDSRLPDLLGVDGVPSLLSGKRPLDDIQFTTVVPAVEKLSGLIDMTIFKQVVDDIAAGEPVKARVRRLLMERGWI